MKHKQLGKYVINFTELRNNARRRLRFENVLKIWCKDRFTIINYSKPSVKCY